MPAAEVKHPALRETRIPGRLEGVAVVPVEMVVPDPETVSVLFLVGGKPIGSPKTFLPTVFVSPARRTSCNSRDPTVRSQSGCTANQWFRGNRAWECQRRRSAQRSPFFTKQHVYSPSWLEVARGLASGVSCQNVNWLRPESQIGAEDSPIVVPTRHAHADSTSQIVVTRSSRSTAMVVAADNEWSFRRRAGMRCRTENNALAICPFFQLASTCQFAPSLERRSALHGWRSPRWARSSWRKTLPCLPGNRRSKSWPVATCSTLPARSNRYT